MYEKKGDPLLSRARFARRVLLSALLASGIITVALSAGILGYHHYARLRWIDSLLNASMILTGMGPVDTLPTTDAKLFASAYALFSGVVFLTSVGLILAPIFHRILHKFHLDEAK